MSLISLYGNLHMNTVHVWQGPLFIVGASRSGTAMLRSVLNRSPDINLAGETHYFDDLRPRVIGKSMRGMTEQERNACADYFRAQTVRPYGAKGDPAQSNLSRETLLAEAELIGDSADSLFEAYCRHRLIGGTARIWGEKTPRHIFRIEEILTLYPQAKIICMVRDARAVVASYRDWNYQGGLPAENNADYTGALKADDQRKHASYHILIASIMWRAAANAAFAALSRHGADRIRIVRYEDATDNPEEVVRDLSVWLGVDFDESLLNVPLHNSSTIKFAAGAGISKAPQNRWRQVLSEKEIGVIQQVAGKTLQRAGYEILPVRSGLTDLAGAYLSVPGAVIRAARANRSRYDSIGKYIMRRLKAAFS
jgi:hypothetical protein